MQIAQTYSFNFNHYNNAVRINGQYRNNVLKTEDSAITPSNKTNNNTRIDISILNKYGIGIAGDIRVKKQQIIKRDLDDIYKPEELIVKRDELFKNLIDILSSTASNRYINEINNKILNKDKVDLTYYYGIALLSLANKLDTNKLISLFEYMSTIPELLDLFHFSLLLRYFVQTDYRDIDCINEIVKLYSKSWLKSSKSGLYCGTDGVDQFPTSIESSSISLNSLALFGLNHAYILDRQQMRIGILESIAMLLLQNASQDQESVEGKSQGKTSIKNLASTFSELAKRQELSYITLIIIRHLERSVQLDKRIRDEDINIFTDLKQDSTKMDKETFEESISNKIDKFIKSPLSNRNESENTTDKPLVLFKHIYPSTHTEVLHELINAKKYSRVAEILNLVISGAKTEYELPISDVYHITYQMLKFRKGSSAIESLLNHEILKSKRILEHIKCCVYECEIERDHKEALRVLHTFEQLGVSISQRLIDDLGNKLDRQQECV